MSVNYVPNQRWIILEDILSCHLIMQASFLDYIYFFFDKNNPQNHQIVSFENNCHFLRRFNIMIKMSYRLGTKFIQIRAIRNE